MQNYHVLPRSIETDPVSLTPRVDTLPTLPKLLLAPMRRQCTIEFLKSFRSSANIASRPPVELSGAPTSAKNVFHSGGAQTAPWQTLFVISRQSDYDPCKTICPLRGARYASRKFKKVAPTPHACNLASIYLGFVRLPEIWSIHCFR